MPNLTTPPDDLPLSQEDGGKGGEHQDLSPPSHEHTEISISIADSEHTVDVNDLVWCEDRTTCRRKLKHKHRVEMRHSVAAYALQLSFLDVWTVSDLHFSYPSVSFCLKGKLCDLHERYVVSKCCVLCPGDAFHAKVIRPSRMIELRCFQCGMPSDTQREPICSVEPALAM